MATTNTMINLPVTGGGGGAGTVTSVAMTVPADLSVAGSPITTAGTFAVTRNTQAANLVLSGPTSGSAAVPTYKTPSQQARITYDGGGATITTGHKTWFSCQFAGTIYGWVLLADQSGSIVITVKKSDYTNFGSPSNIAASAPPTITTAIKNQDTTLTGWTKTVLAGDILEFEVSSVTSIQHAQLFLNIAGS